MLLDDPQSDALLFIHAPTAIVGSTEIANALLPLLRQTQRTVLACWLGGDGVAQARQLFAQAGIACYDTPEQAVRGFMQIVDYRRNQNLLMQVPASLSDQFTPDTGSAQAVINHAIAAGQSLLTEPQAKAVLAAYGIPVVAAQRADSIAAAVKAAQQIGFPVALKLLSPSVRQASDVGGIALDLATMAAVRTAALAMSKRLRLLRPDAAAPAFSIRAMVPRNGAHKLSISVTTDPLFGPTIRFGQGGRVIQVNANSAVGLPPLNAVLALDLVCRAGVDKLVAGSRNRAPANIDAICSSLIQVAHLVSDLAQVIELQINPLLADANGVLALDARIKVTAASSVAAALDRLAIQPYPKELEQTITWQSATLMLRPIRPEDGAAHLRFFAALDPQDVRLRLFSFMRQLSASQLARWTQIDYDREMAFIASRALADGNFETLGVARAIIYDDNITAEFAIVVRSDCKGKGLGTILMRKLIDYCRGRGLQRLVGDALRENRGMLEMIKRLGFETAGSTEPHALSLQLSLRDVGRDRAVVG